MPLAEEVHYLALLIKLMQDSSTQVDLVPILQFWVHHCQNGDACSQDTPGTLHCIGMGLCCAMHRASDPDCGRQYDEETELGGIRDQLLVHATPLQDMSWVEVLDSISALQVEFHNLFEMGAEGYACAIDIEHLLINMMKRIGYWLTHRVSLSTSSEAVRSQYDADDATHSRLRLSGITEVMDALHGLWVAVSLLLRAKRVDATHGETHCVQSVPLYNHHREASLDTFYELSMVADLAPGSILQYKNKFRVLFHSISQVIYFHYPAYQRQIQIPLHELQIYGARSINLLPLLLQIRPETPVRYEHTGAGHMPTLASASWQWVIVGGCVLLVSADGQVFCAPDIRLLHETITAADNMQLN